MLDSAEFWVAVAFFGFVALLLYFKIPARVGEALDNRAAEIRRELDEARKLREEAQAILADYRRRQAQAEEEAQGIIDLARREAEALAEETRVSLQEQLERRTRLAEDKIARAEADAVGQVRAQAVELAVEAAERLIAAKLDDKAAARLVDESIADIAKKLN